MFNWLLNYVLESLVQRKGKNIKWINLLNSGIDSAMSGISFTKKQLLIWKHLLTASREGSGKVRALHGLNMFLKIIITGLLILSWSFLSQWFFPEFNPFSYLDVNGQFWPSILAIGLPMALYAFASGQLDWFGSSDPHEEGTIVAESLPFKWLVSVVAGVTEELSHRGVLIFFGLISVYLSNLFFLWFVGFWLLVIAIFLLAKFEFDLGVAVIMMTISVVLFLALKGHIPENPIYLFNGYLLEFLQWITLSHLRLIFFISVLMTAALGLTTLILKSKQNYRISLSEFATRVLLFTAWATYCMPLGVKAIERMPIMPANSDHWTYLLYIGAVLWSNAQFRNGHKYQGPSGMMNSYVIGLYMFFIAFTHGLIYAIILHVAFDVILFTSEHLCQVIKNRRKAYCVGTW